MSPKVSIVVPIYNAEKFLDNSIASITNQSLHDIEIILVNDGSTDDSLSICYRYKKKDKRIKVINNPNGGVSSARNSGMQQAKGEFVGFVDSDDWIEPEMYESLYAKCKQANADVGMCNYVIDNNSKSIVKLLDLEGNINHQEIIKYLIPNMIGQDSLNSEKENIMGSVCRLVISRRFIRSLNLKFKTDLALMEDLIFCVEVFLKCDYIAFDKRAFYHYITNENSALTSYRPNTIEERLKVNCYLEKLLDNNLTRDIYKTRMKYRYIRMFIISISNEAHKDNPKKTKERIITIKKLCKNKKIKEILTEINTRKYSFKTRLLLSSIKYELKSFLYIYYRRQNKLKGR